MQTRLQVAYRDKAADDLVWRLGDPRHPALATLELDVPGGGRLELRLLGSSHQVVFTARGAVVSEVVACGTGAPGLPPAADRAVDGWDYRFRSSTHSLPPTRFGDRVDRLVARLADDPSAIVGRFPGSPHAVTALLAGVIPGAGRGPGGAGVRWRTWHAYPQDARLVATTTTVRPRNRAAR
jgi:hypothetical protein